MDDIFIQIASYRDPELIPTILDCLEKASDPSRLVFSICWQFEEEEEDLRAITDNDERFTVIEVPWRESKGACWARHELQQSYSGEKYTLCLDSHHRFAPEWDEILIEMLEDTRSRAEFGKPILTSYVTAYDPLKHKGGSEYDHLLDPQPWTLEFDRFTPEGVVFMKPHYLDNWEEYTEPLVCKFLSAHFVFTDGSFVTECPHDPEYYFHGEEISLAARAYTHGYDLFTPHRTMIWHEYTRTYRDHKHWGDHIEGNVDTPWYERNTKCHTRNRILFGMEEGDIDFGPYGFGTVRTLEQYEQHAEINFKKRCELIEGTEENYTLSLSWEEDLSDFDFCAFIVKDADGNELTRKDITRPQKSPLVLSFISKTIPAEYIVWPYKDGWLEPKTYPVTLGY